jgi:16S rRNA processing protein RimM
MDWLEIGTIVAPQGLKGELRVNSSSDFPERFEQPGQRWLQSPDGDRIESVELLSGRSIPGKNLYVIRLTGVEDRERAEALRNYKLLVSKSDRPPLEQDEYHVSDLIDLEVYIQLTGEKLGTVSDVLSAGNDLLEVTLERQILPDLDNENSDCQKAKKPKPATILIPFVKEIVPLVDIEGRRIDITPPPGLLELNNA